MNETTRIRTFVQRLPCLPLKNRQGIIWKDCTAQNKVEDVALQILSRFSATEVERMLDILWENMRRG